MAPGRSWENVAVRMLRHKVYGPWVNRAIQQLFQRYYYAYVPEVYLPVIRSLPEWAQGLDAQQFLLRARPREAHTLWWKAGKSSHTGVLFRFRLRATCQMATYLAKDARYSLGDLDLGSAQPHLLLYLGELTAHNVESMDYCRVRSNKSRIRWTPLQPLQELL